MKIVNPVELLFCFFSIVNASWKTVKISEGVDKKPSSDEVAQSQNKNIISVIPDYMWGPESLFFLNGLCFNKTEHAYEYFLCPFQNITQRRLSGNFQSHLIGIWGYWSSLKWMHYIDGQDCGNGIDRSAVVELVCDYDGENFEILSVKEEINTSCRYRIQFGIPMPCSILAFELKNDPMQSSTIQSKSKSDSNSNRNITNANDKLSVESSNNEKISNTNLPNVLSNKTTRLIPKCRVSPEIRNITNKILMLQQALETFSLKSNEIQESNTNMIMIAANNSNDSNLKSNEENAEDTLDADGYDDYNYWDYAE